MARLIWFHVPGAFLLFTSIQSRHHLTFVADTMDMGPDMSPDEVKARVLIEKKTVLNLLDAFAVAIKHYLRGEEGMLSTRTSTVFDP